VRAWKAAREFETAFKNGLDGIWRPEEADIA
jgi:hypothetical protein